MSSKGRIAPAPAKLLFFKGLAMAILIVLLCELLLPTIAFAYRESAMELIAGNVIVQNQSYSTANRQNLFHTQSAADTDTEAFAFGGTQDGGIDLAQTSSEAAAAQETGFFNSSASSDVTLPVPLSQGYMGTFILDPISVVPAPVGAGVIFPRMIKTEDLTGAGKSTGNQVASNKTASNKTTTNKTAVSDSTPGDLIEENLTRFQPVIDYDLNASEPEPTSATDPNAESNTGKIESRQESPRNRTNGANVEIKPHDPLGHQTNKPFTQSLAPASGPLKASRDLVENLTPWDRFMMNTIGRSTTDRSINGTVSRPTDIRPDKTLAPIVPFQFISDALRMTRPGSRLSNRQWPI